MALSSTYEGEGFDGPCRSCKKLLRKYAPDLKLILVKNKNDIFECSLNDLLDNNSQPSSLQQEPPKPQKIPLQQYSNRAQQQQQYIPITHYVLGQQQNQSPYPYFNNGNQGFFWSYW